MCGRANYQDHTLAGGQCISKSEFVERARCWDPGAVRFNSAVITGGGSSKRSAYSSEFKLQVLSHQDREQLSSRKVAAIYDILNLNQVVVWRRILNQDSVEAFRSRKQGRPMMKPELPCPRPSNMTATYSTQVLREENERLRAEVAYLKKLQALIRSKRSAAPINRV